MRLGSKTLAQILAICLVGAIAGVLVWTGTRRAGVNRVYRIGWHVNPPFQAAGPNGEPTGLSIELVREAARRRGIQLQWVRQQSKADAAIRSGKVDLWPAVSVLPERAGQMHLTEPYMEGSYSFLVRADSRYTNIGSLSEARISHNATRAKRRNLLVLLPKARLLSMPDTEASIEDVCQGRADAAFVDEYSVVPALLDKGICPDQKLRPIPVPGLVMGLAIGSTFDASAAADAIRDEIGKMAGAGELPPAVLRWSYFSHRDLEAAETRRAEQRLLRLLTELIAAVLLILAIMVWLTRRTLRERRKAVLAQKELEATQRNFKLLAEQAADGIVLLDLNGQFVFANSRMGEMLGYTHEELCQLNVRDTYFPEEHEAGWRRLDSLHRGASLRFEALKRRKDGTAIPVEASVVRLEDGRLQKIVRDITERRKSEATLRESEERFRSMADTAPVMIWVAGPDKMFTFVNKIWLDFTGRTLEQELGMGWSQGLHPEDLHRTFDIFCSAFDARRPFRLECRLRRMDGEYRSVLCCGVPHFAPDGKFAGYIGSDTDITDLQSEERFRQLAENIDEVFWMIDLKTNQVLYMSPAFERICGISSASAYRNGAFFREYVHPEDCEPYNAFAEKLRSEPAEGFYRIVRPDGSIRWLHNRSFLVCDPEGRPYRVAGIAEDITARQELEEQLRQAQKMEAVGRLAGGIAHDFNNLLTVIVGYSQILLDSGEVLESGRGRLEQILFAANRATSLTGQLLAFSRRQVPQPQVIGVNQLLRNTEGMLRRLIGEHIRIETVLRPDVDCILMDPHQLEQIVLNLATNARDAMPDGGEFRIETDMVDAAEVPVQENLGNAARYVRLRVSDTGCGMDDRTRERAFEPFFTTKGVGKGTGLGLSIVYGIVRQNQGAIHIVSEPGEGTAFEVYFAGVSKIETRVAAPANRPKQEGSETVLLVEDEPAVRGMVRITLEQFGYTVLEAPDGHEALRTAEEAKGEIHLLLTDVIMPLMNGRELAARLVSLRPETKVLYMSGYTDDTLEMHGVDQPKLHLIQKPFTAAGLAEKIREALAGSGAVM